eukprot:Opistho-2@57346
MCRRHSWSTCCSAASAEVSPPPRSARLDAARHAPRRVVALERTPDRTGLGAAFQQFAYQLAVGVVEHGFVRDIDAALAPGQLLHRLVAQPVQHEAHAGIALQRTGHDGRGHDGQVGHAAVEHAGHRDGIGRLQQPTLLAQLAHQGLVGVAIVKAAHHHHAQLAPLLQQLAEALHRRPRVGQQGDQQRAAADHGYEDAMLVAARRARGRHQQIGPAALEHQLQPRPRHDGEVHVAAVLAGQAAQQLGVHAAHRLADGGDAQTDRSHRHVQGARTLRPGRGRGQEQGQRQQQIRKKAVLFLHHSIPWSCAVPRGSLRLILCDLPRWRTRTVTQQGLGHPANRTGRPGLSFLSGL